MWVSLVVMVLLMIIILKIALFAEIKRWKVRETNERVVAKVHIAILLDNKRRPQSTPRGLE